MMYVAPLLMAVKVSPPMVRTGGGSGQDAVGTLDGGCGGVAIFNLDDGGSGYLERDYFEAVWAGNGDLATAGQGLAVDHVCRARSRVV